MKIYLVRHAEAQSLGHAGIEDDFERPLTDAGHAQARAVAAGLSRLGVRPSLLMTSPLLRARQTAEAMRGEWLSQAPAVRVCEALAPGGKRKELARSLRGLDPEAGVALVGHQPDLGQLAGWLIGSRKARIDFRKAGVAFIACDAEAKKGSGTLVWLATPEWVAVETPSTGHG